MRIEKGFSKGVFSDKNSCLLPSECMDRRLKENRRFRSSRHIRQGLLLPDRQGIVWDIT